MPPYMVCIVFPSAHLGNSKESALKWQHPHSRFRYCKWQDKNESDVW